MTLDGWENWSDYKISDEDRRDFIHRKYIGSGRNWEGRGQFQVEFLRYYGMEELDTVLDIGCGPGRSTVPFVSFLHPAKYYGMDYNEDFLEAARFELEKANLSNKDADLRLVDGFDLENYPPMDFVIVFSVLNHCDDKQREQFFSNIKRVMHINTKVFISHASWFSPNYLPSDISCRTINYPTLVESEFDIEKYWTTGEAFPMLMLWRE